MSGPALEVADLCVDLGGRRVVDGASLKVSRGEMVGLVGANGSGKTTLIRAALGLQRAVSGHCRIGSDPVAALTVAERARRVGYMPQERIVGWNLPAWRVAALGAPLRPPAAARARALEVLAQAGIAHLADRGVLDLSGGERARVLLARLLATDSPLLVTDEPIAGLDPGGQFDTLEVLRAHAAKGGAILATLHDLTLASRYCDRVVVMARGRVVATDLAASVFTPDALETGFGLDGALVGTAYGAVLASQRAGASIV